jgi:hypothetical protein
MTRAAVAEVAAAVRFVNLTAHTLVYGTLPRAVLHLVVVIAVDLTRRQFR